MTLFEIGSIALFARLIAKLGVWGQSTLDACMDSVHNTRPEITTKTSLLMSTEGLGCIKSAFQSSHPGGSPVVLTAMTVGGIASLREALTLLKKKDGSYTMATMYLGLAYGPLGQVWEGLVPTTGQVGQAAFDKMQTVVWSMFVAKNLQKAAQDFNTKPVKALLHGISAFASACFLLNPIRVNGANDWF